MAYPNVLEDLRTCARLGVPWLSRTCGSYAFCAGEAENLCGNAQFTG